MAPLPPGEPRAHVLRRFEERLGPDENLVFHFSPGGPHRLGIEFTDMGEQLAEHFKVAGKAGVLVTSVAPDTAAAKAGLKAGDVLLEFDGQKIERGADLQRAVARAEGGKKIAVKAQRDGRPLDLEVTLEGSAVERRRAPGVTL